jgi:hypothetical protein
VIKPLLGFVVILLFLIVSFLAVGCRHSTEPPLPTGPGTTSHDFVWTMYEFGEWSPSRLNDVAIISDTLAYAAGEIYLKDSTGQIDPSRYNAISWDGRTWDLKQITVSFRGSFVTPPLYGAFCLSASQIWMAASGAVIYGDGHTWTLYDVRVITGFDTLSSTKCWGTSSASMYFVGRQGSFVFYNGASWQRIITGTTIELLDVWGSADGKTVWTCGYSSDYSQSVLLKISGQSVQQVWSRQGSITQPYGDLLTSIWAKDHLFLTSNYGVYRQGTSDTIGVQRVLSTTSFPFRIRGSAENNIAVAGDEGKIWHYNGATWKELYDSPGVPLYSIAVSTNLIIAVGCDFNVFPPKAVACVGRRD